MFMLVNEPRRVRLVFLALQPVTLELEKRHSSNGSVLVSDGLETVSNFLQTMRPSPCRARAGHERVLRFSFRWRWCTGGNCLCTAE